MAINLYAKIRHISLFSQSYPPAMKISRSSLPILALGTLILMICSCSGKPSLLRVDTFDDQGQVQMIGVRPVSGLDGEEGLFGEVGRTCEFKDSKEECVGVKMLVVGKDMVPEQVYAVKLVGTLIIDLEGKSRTLVVAIPFDKDKRTIDPRHFMEFFVDREPLKRSIEKWFMSEYGPDAQLLGWDNDEFGRGHIERHRYENK